jgi:hypothetical protein
MSIWFHCPRCQQALKAPERVAGLLGYCPTCGGTLLFPGERTIGPDEEARLTEGDRLAEPQTLRDRLRPWTAVPWSVSFAVHVVVIAALGVLTWRAATPDEGPTHRVNILLDLGNQDGGPRYRGPRELALQPRSEAPRDRLSDLLKERPPTPLIEVGAGHGAARPDLPDLNLAEGAGGGFATEFMSLGARARRFVYLVDKSSSMGNDGRLELAKAELKASIEMLPEAAAFHVIFFDLATRIEMPSDRLIAATRDNKDRCYQRLAQVTPSGGTDPMPAFRKALELQPDVIFFLTDGRIFSDLALERRVPDRVRLMNIELAKDRAVIHTVCLLDRNGLETLQQIADQNHGRCRFVDEEAAQRLRQRHRPGT